MDVALEHTGYALYNVSTGNMSFALLTMGILQTDASADEDTRVRSLLSEINKIQSASSPNCYMLEQPGQSIYGAAKMSPGLVAARAKSVAQVKGACHAVVGYCFALGIYCRVVQPIQWQGHGPRKAQLTSKQWSVREANKVLQYLKLGRKLKNSEDHVADAINIGIHAIKNFNDKKWIAPNLYE